MAISKEAFVEEFTDLAAEAGIDRPCRLDFPRYMSERHRRDGRSYAEVDPYHYKFSFAIEVLSLPRAHRRGLLMHELGHCLCPEGSEDDADRAAAEVFGERIAYDRRWPGKGLQCVQSIQRNPGNVWYHGSPRLFRQFHKHKKAGVTSEAVNQPIFFSPSKKFAALHAGPSGYIYTVRVDIPAEQIFDPDQLLDDQEHRYWQDGITDLGHELEAALEDGLFGAEPEEIDDYFLAVARGNWDALGHPDMLRWMQNKGYKGFFEKGEGEENLAVFDPADVEIVSVEMIEELRRLEKNPPYSGYDPSYYQKPLPPDPTQIAYEKKRDALNVFADWNRRLIDDYGGMSTKHSPESFEAINHKFDIKGRRRVDTLAKALWWALPPGSPYYLEDIDVELLNRTAPVLYNPDGLVFTIPDYAEERRLLEQEAEYWERYRDVEYPEDEEDDLADVPF